MRTPILFLFILLSFAAVQAQSIETYQQEAALNNPSLKVAYQNYLSVQKQQPQARSLPDPEVSFAWFIQPVETRLGPQQARISVSQMFPWFGSLQDRESVADARARAAFEQFREQRNLLFFRMEQLWAQLYETQENIRIAEANLEIITTLVQLSLRRYENGQVSQVDVLRAQIEEEDLRTQIELSKDHLQLLMNRFNELRNVEPDANTQLPDTLIPPILKLTEQELKEMAINQNPKLNRLRMLEDASSAMVDVASKDGKPSFGLGLDYIATGERTDVANLADNGRDALIARASFRIPLFRKKYDANVQQAEFNLGAVQNEINTTSNRLETQFLESLKEKRDAQRRFDLYDSKQISRVQQALNILVQSYSADNTNFEEILRLQRRLLDYQLKRIQALTDQYVSISRLQYLSGHHNINLNELND